MCIWQVEARDAKYPKIHRTSPRTKNYLAQTVNAEIEKLWFGSTVKGTEVLQESYGIWNQMTFEISPNPEKAHYFINLGEEKRPGS